MAEEPIYIRRDEVMIDPSKVQPYEERREWLRKWREMVGDQLLGGYATGPHHPPRVRSKGGPSPEAE